MEYLDRQQAGGAHREQTHSLVWWEELCPAREISVPGAWRLASGVMLDKRLTSAVVPWQQNGTNTTCLLPQMVVSESK